MLTQTPRLHFRRFRMLDLPSLEALLGDVDVMAFSDHGALTIEQQGDWLAQAMTIKPEARLGIWAIESAETMAVIGYVSMSRDPARVEGGETEIGIRLVRAAWGQGYAREVLECVLASGGLEGRAVATIDPHNVRSVRLFVSLGFAKAGEIMFAGYDYPDHRYVRCLNV